MYPIESEENLVIHLGATSKTGATHSKVKGSGATSVEGRPNEDQKQQQPAESANTGEQDVATFPNMG